MSTKLYWIDGPWPGKLAMSARPRGGDWLEDEMQGWRDAGVDIILSLLTPEEERELELMGESREATAKRMRFVSLPIPDRQVPSSPSEVAAILESLDADLAAGKNAVIHCRQGIGRSGMLTASLLVMKGRDPESAVTELGRVRGAPIPETQEQRRWIDHFASTLAHAK